MASSLSQALVMNSKDSNRNPVFFLREEPQDRKLGVKFQKEKTHKRGTPNPIYKVGLNLLIDLGLSLGG